jgi:hypothetical protein
VTSVVFLDIDGVLLPGRAWRLPENADLAAALRDGRHTPGEAAARVAFDRGAVERLNRLCEETGARLVVHSNWRHTVGPDATRAKLVEQGVDERHFHADWWTPTFRSFRSPRKYYDVVDWLDDHDMARDGPGFLVIDDETVTLPFLTELPQITPSYEDGFDEAAFGAARGLLLGAAAAPGP